MYHQIGWWIIIELMFLDSLLCIMSLPRHSDRLEVAPNLLFRWYDHPHMWQVLHDCWRERQKTRAISSGQHLKILKPMQPILDPSIQIPYIKCYCRVGVLQSVPASKQRRSIYGVVLVGHIQPCISPSFSSCIKDRFTPVVSYFGWSCHHVSHVWAPHSSNSTCNHQPFEGDFEAYSFEIFFDKGI